MKSFALSRCIRLSAVLVTVVGVFAAGCSQQTARLDELDFRDPLIRKAQSRVRQGDKEGAINCLNKAIERRPDLAQAHLELALLYHDYKKDYIKAIYHYQYYLDLRPAAQKRELIEDLTRKAKMSFAASIYEQYPETAKKMQALEEENNRLKVSLREVRENLANRLKGEPIRVVSATKEGLSSAPPAKITGTSPVQSGEPTSTVYCVQSGDTLSSIAAKMYHNPKKWKIILDANSSNLTSPGRLKSGQILTIPR